MGVTGLSIEERKWDMTLGGQQVVTCTMCLPRVEGTGTAVRRLAGHYRRLEKLWTDYVRRELYLYACLELAQKQERGSAFRPWQGTLECKIGWQKGGVVGIRVRWREQRGFRSAQQRTWGDAWYTDSGEVCTLRAFAPHKRLGARWLRNRPGGEAIGRCRQFYPDLDGLHLIDRAGRERTVRIT